MMIRRLERKRNELAFPHATRRTFEYVFDSGTNLVVVDFDYPVEELPTDAEGLLANNAHRRAVAERANFGKENALALFQTARHRVPVDRFDANDARARTTDALNVFAYARDEASSADGPKDSVEMLSVGDLFEDFHPDGALTGDHERVIVRGHKDEAMHSGEAGTLGLGLIKVGSMEDDFGAKACDVADFDRGCALGHHDGAWDAEARTGEGDALGVVPWTGAGCVSGLLRVHAGKRCIRLTGAASDDAFPPLLLGKAGHKVVRAANFEAEDLLEILALEIDLVSKFCAQIGGMHKWCLFKDLVDLGIQDKAEIVRGICG